MLKKIKPYLNGFWYSLPIQLLLLHFKRYQIILFFWYLLFATLNGNFMYKFGAHMLYLTPEYLGKVNMLSMGLVGLSIGIFVISWNITTFILNHQHIRFLATTAQPFLKYCVNNAIIPLAFLIFYFVKFIQFSSSQELLSAGKIFLLLSGFMLGLILTIAIALSYFFGADKTIYRFMSPSMKDELKRLKYELENKEHIKHKNLMRVDWYFGSYLKIKKPRDVYHYTQDFIDRIFKQHHLAAIFSIFIAFISLITLGIFLDNPYLQLPAAGSSTVFFAVLIAVAGALSHFLKEWSVPFAILAILVANVFLQKNIIDPRNKAYGLNYENKLERPNYSVDQLNLLCSENNMSKDSLAYIQILNKWKLKQDSAKPILYVLCTSGGGSRSALFTMNVLSGMDSIMNGNLMKKLVLITGASGGMIGATYYRELYLQSLTKNINPNNKIYAENIGKDLLNPIFASFVSRDLLAPAQFFKYKNFDFIKDRGYAFEQKLIENTDGVLNKSIGDYTIAEANAQIPISFYNNVVTQDGKKMIMATRPTRFLMKPILATNKFNQPEPDAIDMMSFFENQNPQNLRLTSALRMNATFPYVLPNVMLPSNPTIDVMDAGFRDNTGMDISMRFLFNFRNWINENCSDVVFLQIRGSSVSTYDRKESIESIFSLVTKPALLTQTNMFLFQEYAQQNDIQYFSSLMQVPVRRILFEYIPNQNKEGASLSFHLTQREKLDIENSMNTGPNQKALELMWLTKN